MAAPILPAFYLNKLLALLLYRVQTDEKKYGSIYSADVVIITKVLLGWMC